MSLRRMLAVAVVTAVSLAMLGCADNAPAGPPEVTLGTGDTAFEPVADQADIFVVQGPQGGFHVVGSVRTRNLRAGDPESLQDPDNPTTEFRVFAGSERVDSRVSSYTQGLDPVAGSDEHEMVGRLVILDIQADDELDGVAIRVEVEVVDVDGQRASDARDLIATPHPNNL